MIEQGRRVQLTVGWRERTPGPLIIIITLCSTENFPRQDIVEARVIPEHHPPSVGAASEGERHSPARPGKTPQNRAKQGEPEAALDTHLAPMAP
jgi:hypothetical protein